MTEKTAGPISPGRIERVAAVIHGIYGDKPWRLATSTERENALHAAEAAICDIEDHDG